uniref:Translation initiation factor eIF2B subunit delta n=1 Tax=Panagrellus redivivus TaxID=6233 RepID=A0A7E4UQ61_PANRE
MGKKKGHNKPQPANSPIAPQAVPETPEKLNAIAEQLKSFSPKKGQATPPSTPEGSNSAPAAALPLATSTPKAQEKADKRPAKAKGKPEDLNDGDGKSRADIENERKAKKLEKQMKKEAATAKKKADAAAGNAEKPPKAPAKEAPANKGQKDAPKTPQQPSKPALKKHFASSDSSDSFNMTANGSKNVSFKEKSNLKVRFDIQPSNQYDLTERPAIRVSSYFVHATPHNVHPAFRRLAAKCEFKKLNGVNELLLAFHKTLIEFVEDYNPRPDLPFSESISLDLQPQLCCLSDNGVHPFPQAVGNLIRLFKKQIHELDNTKEICDLKTYLKEWIENSAYYNFDLAEKAIVEFTISKLKSMAHRRILTYSRCPIVEKIILTAAEQFNDLHVYIVDDPNNGSRGKTMLESLSEASIPCTYGHINSIGYLVHQASVVLLGCSAILNTGRVVALRGSSLLALSAQAVNIPVLVAAKTCTFVDKVRLDEHLSTALLREPIETIPEDLVTALVTDLRIVPPSSAPAVLKAKQLGYDN